MSMFPSVFYKNASPLVLPDISHVMTIIIKPVGFIFFGGVVLWLLLDGVEIFSLHNGLIVTHGEAWTLQCPRNYYPPVID